MPSGEVIRSDQTNIHQLLSNALLRPVSLKTQAPLNPILEQYHPEANGEGNDLVITEERIAGDAPEGTFFDYAMVHILTTATLEQLGVVDA